MKYYLIRLEPDSRERTKKASSEYEIISYIITNDIVIIDDIYVNPSCRFNESVK
jgi:hypothetical protein